MSIGKLTLTENTTLEQVTNYFKNLGPDKQVRARELWDGRIQLYVRKDSAKQFFTDKLKPDYLIKRDYANAKQQIIDIASRMDIAKRMGMPRDKESPIQAHLTFSVKRAIEGPSEPHKHDIFTNEFNRRTADFMTPKK
jgi:hypothetical protein